MKLKPVLTVGLLIFVLLSVVGIIVKERKPVANAASSETLTPSPSEMKTSAAPVLLPDRTVVYYFHGNKRCYTCKKIESYTQTAVKTEFEKALKEGTITLCIINVEEPDHEHFVKDYQLTNRSVVVARYENNEQKSWKNLEKVWELVGDEGAFIDYIRTETLSMQKGES